MSSPTGKIHPCQGQLSSLRLSVIASWLPAAPSGEPGATRARQLAGKFARGLDRLSARATTAHGTCSCRARWITKAEYHQHADYEEAARCSGATAEAALSPDCTGNTVSHDRWGFQGRLVIADPAATPRLSARTASGRASWSPDGKQIPAWFPRHPDRRPGGKKWFAACRARNLPAALLVAGWKWFCGTGNHLGVMWTVVRLHLATGKLNAVHKFQSCTPAWFPDSKHIIFSSRPAGQTAGGGYGWTQLWMAVGDGSSEQLVYGEDGCHVYGGALSPDGQYVLFTKSLKDGGGSEDSGGAICLMRFSDAPTIGGASEELRAKHAGTKDGPVVGSLPGLGAPAGL